MNLPAAELQQARDRLKPLRFQVVLSAESMERLDQLQRDMDVTSRADVLRTALRVLETLRQEQAKGGELWVKTADGKEHPYKLLY